MSALGTLKHIAMMQFHMKLAPLNLTRLDHSKPLVVASVATHRIRYVLLTYVHGSIIFANIGVASPM